MSARAPRVSPSPAAISALLEQCRVRHGLDFTGTRRDAAIAALVDAWHAHAVQSVAHFNAAVFAEPAAAGSLLAALTVGESYFFRDPDQLEFVASQLARPSRADRPRRGWSAGCATGEEPFSLAMLARERGTRITMLGTDLSAARVTEAARLRWRPWALRATSAVRRQRWFRATGEAWTLVPEVRGDVAFGVLDLVGAPDALLPPPAAFDVVCCRNVFIYFDDAAIRHVATRLVRRLAPRGVLLLAASDPPLEAYVPGYVRLETGGGPAYVRRTRIGRTATARRTVGGDGASPPPPIAPPIAPVMPVPPATGTMRMAPAVAPRMQPANTPRPPHGESAPVPPTSPMHTSATRTSPTHSAPTHHSQVRPAPRGAPHDDAARQARHVARTRRLVDAERLEAGERWCLVGLERWPDAAALHVLHAVVLLRRGHARAALVAAELAARTASVRPEARLLAGAALVALGEPEAARRAAAGRAAPGWRPDADA